ncbi:MAG: hypothetical protein IT285_00535 [Bdellovibrionales bacterium]|nr:hypothetical protein [Bdellovibrionales bacterium]
MKILLLNPHIDAEHEYVRGLQARSVGVLVPADASEAWQMLQLHGSSVDLAIVHREGEGGRGEDGLDFVKQFKSDPVQADLPFLLTTEKWSEAECAQHQAGAQGANAYLIAPFGLEKLAEIIEAVTGQKLAAPLANGAKAAQAKVAAPKPAAPAPKAKPSKAPFSGEEQSIPGLVLEDASELFSAAEVYEASDTSIRLEMPVMAEDASAPALAPAGAESIAMDLGGSGEVLEMGAPGEISIPTAGGAAEFSAGESEIEANKPAKTQSIQELKAQFEQVRLSPEEPETREAPSALDELPAFEPAHVDEISQPEISQPEIESQAAQEMPYLYSRAGSGGGVPARMVYTPPVGDAVVPGGAASSPDVETLKKFLLLREQDVAALSAQLRTAREQNASIEDELRKERARGVELGHQVSDQGRRIENFEKEKEDALVGLRAELDDLNFKLKVKTDKAKILEAKVRAATEEMERLKERVRADIRKIRVREKELENKLEIIRRDSEVLLTARENKVIELKRKLDLLEFNMDLLQDQYNKEKELSAQLREKLGRAAQAMRVAGGLLDNEEDGQGREAS